MRQVYKALIFSVIVLFAISCEDLGDNRLYNVGDGFVQFQSTSASTFEDGDAMTIGVLLGSGENSSGVSVNFDVIIESGDASRFEVSPANGVLDIPEGEFTGEITITPIDNLDADGNVVIRVELSESSSVPVGVAGEGLEGTSAVFTINDNDCPTEISDSYGVRVFAFGAEAPSHTVDLVPVPGTDNQWTITSSWGPEFVAWATGSAGFSGIYIYPGTIVLNEDFTVDFIGDTVPEVGFDYSGPSSGVYSSCDDQFTITLSQNLFTTAFTVDIVMTGI
ncbi:hypothetical protein [Lentiprolixibacter aurantiacus]|uniref:Calx-beta domain-containing protein n=1 Tax=Lentiprolixibacter aurantiacus TaxID=2993939 RepID=A0AAE3SLR7_9FLAO|nr:hypothetical protein [Lentiprolixibacter aurantiacus]MCX2717972.1 hypothetical protein [Lentiprolixibacter aurantiacus]